MQAWDRYVQASPACVHYHLSGWKTVLERTYGNRTCYLGACSGADVQGILPLAFVSGFPSVPHLASLPYLSYAGLAASTRAAAAEMLLAADSRRIDFGARYVEMHNLTDAAGSHDTSSQSASRALTTHTDKVRMVLPLSDNPDRLWKAFDPKVRNQVRKATKSGLRVEIGGREFLESFYPVFAENMRDLGSPVHRFALFVNAFDIFPAHFKCFIVLKDDTPIGGAIFLAFKGLAEVPWASSKREYFQYCPNNLLYWEVLKHACALGLGEFDFGRSSKESGTYRFKEQWGAKPRPLYWQYALPERSSAPDPSHTGAKARLMVRVWQSLPLPLANALGPRVRGRISA